MKKAFIAKAARGGDSAHLPSRAYNKLNADVQKLTDALIQGVPILLQQKRSSRILR